MERSRRHCGRRVLGLTNQPGRGRCPVTNITRGDAADFCSWAGLRLPTGLEWSWAALGAPIGCLDALGTGTGCDEKRQGFDDEGCLHTRRFPWGDDPATPARCAAADRRYSRGADNTLVELRASGSLSVGDLVVAGAGGEVYRAGRFDMPLGVVSASPRGVNGRSLVQVSIPSRWGGSTAPVLEKFNVSLHGRLSHDTRTARETLDALEEFVPARPMGASWCGICGWSFRGEGHSTWRTDSAGHYAPADDVGFRVALSATS